jgi:uncharacterized protein
MCTTSYGGTHLSMNDFDIAVLGIVGVMLIPIWIRGNKKCTSGSSEVTPRVAEVTPRVMPKAVAFAKVCELPSVDVIWDAVRDLKILFAGKNIPENHGINHARRVLKHVRWAIMNDRNKHSSKMDSDQEIAVQLAAILHHADDHKYFPESNNYKNARTIIWNVRCRDLEELVIQMIKYTSISFYDNSIPEDIGESSWLLYPRWADRLDAIGYPGVIRVWEYSEKNGWPLYSANTQKGLTNDEILQIAADQKSIDPISPDNKSGSMIDYYYDKLLHIKIVCPDNEYLTSEALSRMNPLIEVCRDYGRGILDVRTLNLARAKFEIED